MARNRIPTHISSLLAMAGAAADGAQTHGTALGLQLNTATRIRAERQALVVTASAYDARKAARAQHTGLRAQESEKTRVFIAQVVDALRPWLGREWSPAWQAAGFINKTLSLPKTQGERLGLLALLEAYFLQNPGQENVPLGATAASCAGRLSAFAAACAAVDQAEQEAVAARQVRETAWEVLERRMRSLFDELGQLMGEDDARWHGFGLNAPADPETPAVPEAARIEAGTAGSQTLRLGWSHAPRADRYRVRVGLPGNAEPLVIQTAEGEQATVNLQGLAPSGVAIEVALSAANEAGESRYSAAQRVLVP